MVTVFLASGPQEETQEKSYEKGSRALEERDRFILKQSRTAERP